LSIKKQYLKVAVYFERYSWILGVAIIIYAISLYVNSRVELKANKSETYGTVYGRTLIFNGRFGRNIYKYEFFYKGKKYFGTSAKLGPSWVLKGLIFKVDFSTEDPNNNEIFFDKEYTRKIEFDKNEQTIDTIYLLKN
jgi:hypothetical protein